MTRSAVQHVTAVVTVDRRPETLIDAVRSITQQHRVPDRVIIVTTSGTIDPAVVAESTRELTDADLDWHHVERPRTPGRSLADELSAVMEPAEPGESSGKSGESSTSDDRWIWFLHDDAVAEPHALQAVLRAVEVSPSVALAGAKQVERARPRHLLDVGVTMTHTGHAVSMIEPGELDQGQYDDRTDVLSVSAPGMLVREDVWRELDGVDPATPGPAAALDLCLRTRLAGHRVVVVPRAVVRHGGHGEGLQASRRERHEAAAWMRLKHSRARLTLPLLWLWMMLSAVGSLAWSLLIKEPGAGMARLGGTLQGATRPFALLRSRRRARSTQTLSAVRAASIRDLRPRRAQVRAYRRSVIDVSEPDEVIGAGTGSTHLDSEPTGGHDDFTALATPERNWVGIGLVTALLLLGAVAVLGLRSLLGAEAVAGGSLAPLDGSLRDLWETAVSGWSESGVGFAAQPGPFGLVLVLLGLTGSASVSVVVLMILTLPLAAAGAWTAAGAIARSRAARFAVALAWGLAPTLLMSIGQGRLGAILVHLLLPWLVLSLMRATGSAAPRRRDPGSLHSDAPTGPGTRGVISWTGSGWTALLLALITAAAPSLLVPAVLSVLILAAVMRSRGRALWWTPALTLALFAPAVVTHWNNLRAVLADPGVPLSFTAAPGWQQLLGFPTEFTADAGLLAVPGLDSLVPGFPWALLIALVIAGPLLILAVLGVFSLRPAGTTARVGLIVTAVGLATAWVATQITVSVDSLGAPVTLFTGPAVSVVWLGLMMAAVAGFDLVHRLQRVAVPAVALAMVGAVAVSATVWLVPRLTGAESQDRQRAALEARATTGESDPELSALTASSLIYPTSIRQVPATAADQALSELSTRTLIISRSGEGVTAAAVAGAGEALNRSSGGVVTRTLTGGIFTPESAETDPADEALRTLAAELVAGTTNDPRSQLTSIGAAFVVLRDPDGVDQTTAANLDAVPGLTPVGLTEHGWLWRVEPASDNGAPVLSDDTGSEPDTEARGFAVARAAVQDDGGTTLALIPSEHGRFHAEVPAAEEESTERRVVLAERAHDRWSATYNGQALEATEAPEGWNQAFVLPAEAGELEIHYDAPVPRWYWVVPGVLLLIALLLAIPSPTRRTASRTQDRPLDAGDSAVDPLEDSTDDDADWTAQR